MVSVFSCPFLALVGLGRGRGGWNERLKLRIQPLWGPFEVSQREASQGPALAMGFPPGSCRALRKYSQDWRPGSRCSHVFAGVGGVALRGHALGGCVAWEVRVGSQGLGGGWRWAA